MEIENIKNKVVYMEQTVSNWYANRFDLDKLASIPTENIEVRRCTYTILKNAEKVHMDKYCVKDPSTNNKKVEFFYEVYGDKVKRKIYQVVKRKDMSSNDKMKELANDYLVDSVLDRISKIYSPIPKEDF